MNTVLYDRWFNSGHDRFRIWTRQEVLVSLAAENLLMTYLGLYLGITFLITACAVLAIQQMAHSADNAKRHNLLKKLGASRADINSSLTKQLKVYFGVPMLLAVLHTFIVVSAVFHSMEGRTPGSILAIIGSDALLVFVVYAVYFITTYLGSKRILQPIDYLKRRPHLVQHLGLSNAVLNGENMAHIFKTFITN